jgi:plasmid stabilization system protein ParE
MKRLVLSKGAFKDLAEIWHFIAADNVDAADRVRDDLEKAMGKLAEMPAMGHRRSDVSNSDYRFWRVYSYLIAYRVQRKTLYVSRVIHGARNLRPLFKRKRTR